MGKQIQKDTKDNDKPIENKNKETIHEVPEETIRKNSIHNDAKTSKVKEEAEILEKVETQTNLKENFELSLEETKTNDLKNANSAHTSGIIDEKRENQEVENTNQLTKENVEKEFSAPKSEPEISINLKEKESTTKYDDKIKIQGKMDEIKESDSFHKDDSKKKKDSKSRKRTREFKPNELDALRDEFAKKQGVKETKDTTKVINTNQTEFDQKQDVDGPKDIVTNRPVGTNNTNLEENISVKRDPTPPVVVKEQLCIHDIAVKNDCEPCDNENIKPIKEERKKKNRKSKDIKESESLYEPVGKGRETSLPLSEMQQSDSDKVETKEIHFEPKTSPKPSGTISNITDDLKDFGSLRQKKRQPEKTGSSIENLQKAEFNHNEIADFKRKDDVIGFDIDISNDDDKNPFITDEEFEEIQVSKEIEFFKEIEDSKEIKDSEAFKEKKDLESPSK